jgi:hypothetical protein
MATLRRATMARDVIVRATMARATMARDVIVCRYCFPLLLAGLTQQRRAHRFGGNTRNSREEMLYAGVDSLHLLPHRLEQPARHAENQQVGHRKHDA